MPIRQEKFQRVVEDTEREDHQWVFPSEDLGGLSRGTLEGGKGVFHRRITTAGPPLDAAGTPVTRLNILPPTGIDDWVTDEEQMPFSRRAGASDVSDYLASRESLRDVFTRCPFAATDDQYTGQHMDLFYDTPEGKDDAGDTYDGFVERNNYLDRS